MQESEYFGETQQCTVLPMIAPHTNIDGSFVEGVLAFHKVLTMFYIYQSPHYRV